MSSAGTVEGHACSWGTASGTPVFVMGRAAVNASYSSVALSRDGFTWTQLSAPVSNVRAVVVVNQIIFVGGSGTVLLAMSVDGGATWVMLPTPAFGWVWAFTPLPGSQLLIVGGFGTSSSQGQLQNASGSFTKLNVSFSFAAFGAAYGRGIYLVGGGNSGSVAGVPPYFWISSDGFNWSNESVDLSPAPLVRGLVYSPVLDRFVATLSYFSPLNALFYSSRDGVNWTPGSNLSLSGASIYFATAFTPEIVSSLGTSQSGSVALPPDGVVTVNGPVTVVGDLSIFSSSVTFASDAVVKITGSLSFGATTVVHIESGAKIVVGGVLLVAPNAVLKIVSNSTSVVVALYGSISGVFATATYNDCTASVSYGLSLLTAMPNCGGGSGLSGGAIAGIVVGSVVLAAIVVISVVGVVLSRRKTRQQFAIVNAKLGV
jgi:hypothetical protein